jgi:O-acetyl-ADP-ribose deacetylase (regulator of RNase III)
MRPMTTAPPQAISLAPGQRFHGLLVHSVLGEGAMGAAYLVSHPVLQTPLVLKIFKIIASKDLFREAHLAARVRSPHAVAAIDAGVADGVPFIVQPYVDGIDLAELLRFFQSLGRPLPHGLVNRAVLDVARGLHDIHQAGIVHRDVKPGNLFLRGDGITSVGDFGIAVDPLGAAEHGQVAGTPLYMAPELWAGEPVTRSVDLYALGATGHYLAAGAPPFRGKTPVDIGRAHREDPYVAPAASDPREAYFFAVMSRLLRKRPEERHQSAESVARELELIVEPEPPWLRRSADEAHVGGIWIRLRRGDIAAAEADVIVNAANGALAMEVGVARALRRAGGEVIAQEAAAQAPVPMGAVAWTGPGQLKARYVAHAVAAIEGATCLQRCMLRLFLGAEARGARTISCPSLGTGVGGVPMALAASLMLEAVQTFATLEPKSLIAIEFVLYDEPALETWRNILRSM